MGSYLKTLLMVFALATMTLHGVLGHVHDDGGQPTSPLQGCSAACPVHSGAAHSADPTPVLPVPHVQQVAPEHLAKPFTPGVRPTQPANPRAPPLA